MWLRLFFSAAFKPSNIGVLLIGIGGAYIASEKFPYLAAVLYSAGVGPYLLAVVLSLASKGFHEEFNHKQKIRQIRRLDRECQRLSYEARRQISHPYQQRLKKVLDSKNEILNSFFRGDKNYLKEKIVEQTLNLVAVYIKLLVNYCLRMRELGQVDIGEVTNRINLNLRKLNFTKDPHTADDIRKVIEMDENTINRLKEEKNELERLNAKLDYMEGSVNMLKHQILSSVETQEMLEKLESTVNEVSALDSVLQEKRRNRTRV